MGLWIDLARADILQEHDTRATLIKREQVSCSIGVVTYPLQEKEVEREITQGGL